MSQHLCVSMCMRVCVCVTIIWLRQQVARGNIFCPMIWGSYTSVCAYCRECVCLQANKHSGVKGNKSKVKYKHTNVWNRISEKHLFNLMDFVSAIMSINTQCITHTVLSCIKTWIWIWLKWCIFLPLTGYMCFMFHKFFKLRKETKGAVIISLWMCFYNDTGDQAAHRVTVGLMLEQQETCLWCSQVSVV